MRLFVLLIPLLLPLSVSAGEIIRDPATVKAIFSNKTVDAYHLKRETAWTNYFAADGTMRRITEDGDRHTGKWYINDRAEHCVN